MGRDRLDCHVSLLVLANLSWAFLNILFFFFFVLFFLSPSREVYTAQNRDDDDGKTSARRVEVDDATTNRQFCLCVLVSQVTDWLECSVVSWC